MSKIFLLNHLGLGDHLVTNAIVRACARKHSEVIVPCKPHNIKTVQFMYRDLKNVTLISADDDHQMLASAVANPVLGLGMFGKGYDHKKGDWDRQMYEQAGVDFEDRWKGFKVLRDPSSEVPSRPGMTFLHQDEKRGFIVDKRRIPSDAVVVQPYKTETLFNWWDVIKQAEEIHCIDSSFAIFVDSIPTTAKRLVLHLYARPGARPPIYRKPWEILK